MVNNKLLYSFGALFLGIAAVLTIQELDLGVGWSVALALTLLSGGAMFVRSRMAQASTTGLFAFLGLVGPIAYFWTNGEASYFASTVVYFAGSMFLAFRYGLELKAVMAGDGPEARVENSRAVAIAAGAIASSLGFLWVTYFRYLTSMQDEFIGRRLVFTLFLLVVGVALAVLGRARASTLIGYGGMAYLLAGVGKALAYDTTHVVGFLRIGIFAAGGVILLVGAALISRREQTQ